MVHLNISNRYQSEDRSIVTKYVLKPFWKEFANIFPIWMAPNVVTLSGFGFIVVNVLTTLYFDPTLSEGSPRWAYFTYAFGIFMYQTFDACDGIHARRTGQSGPLGELFDHCIDSLNTTLSLIPFSSAARLGYTHVFVLSQFALLCNFYLSTWEEYHTHKLFLSEFSGPVEGIISLCFTFILCGLYGADTVWHHKITTVSLGGTSSTFETIHAWIIFSCVGLLFNIVAARKNVIEYYRSVTSDEEKNEKEISKAMDGLLPFFIYFASVFLIILIQPKFIDLPFILSIGFTMAFVVGRIIVGHLTKQPFPMVNFSMFIPVIQIALYMLAVCFFDYPVSDVIFALTWLGLGASLGIHSMFINEIVYDFTTYLDVYALSIKHKKFA